MPRKGNDIYRGLLRKEDGAKMCKCPNSRE